MAALTPLVGIGDLEDLLEGDVSDEARAWALIAATSTLVRALSGSAWVDADGELDWTDTTDEKLKLVGDALTQVTAEAAKRAYLNPNSATSETTGPFSISRGEEAAAGIYLTEVEQKTIASAVALYRGSSSPGLWTLATTRSDSCRTDVPGTTCDPRTGDLYLDTDDGAPIPFVTGDQLG